MMLSYVYFGTNDLERAIRFYDATLAPLGMPRCVTGDPQWDCVAAGWGIYENGARANLDFGLAIHSTRDRPRWATVAWLHSAHARGKRWMIFTPRLAPTAEVVTVLPVFDCTTAQISMRPTCAIWMGISWPRSAVALQKDNEELAARSLSWT